MNSLLSKDADRTGEIILSNRRTFDIGKIVCCLIMM
jgi:hypothetical protein